MNPQLDKGQLEAVEKLRNGCILCGGVGSGKSRTGLVYYTCKVCGGMIDGKDHGFESDFVPMQNPVDLYIITTAKKRDKREWDDELVPFLLSRDFEQSFYGDKVKVVVDSWNNIKRYKNITGAFFLFDEQRVVGKGAWAKSFIKIAKNNQWIFLSATPGDTWIDYVSIFIANGFFRNRYDFESRHVVYKRYTKYPDIERYMDESYLAQLRDSILVDIPYEKGTQRHLEYRQVGFDREVYRFLIKKRWNETEQRPIESVSELCYLLRKSVNSDASRSDSVLDICSEHARVIVFYKYDFELEILRGLSYMDGTVVAEWNGHKHEEVPESDRWVYLVQYASGAEGWNCITTNAMLFYSLDYSYKSMEQAMGRIDRRNTPYEDLYYYIFCSKAPIDQAILRALKQKKNFNERRFFSNF